MPATETGIAFENKITDTDTLNILDYLYYYNGGGVAIADFNNDGLPDIYFTSNQGSNKLYLNKGGFKFEDITDKAGVQGKGNWKTGVTVSVILFSKAIPVSVAGIDENNRSFLFLHPQKMIPM